MGLAAIMAVSAMSISAFAAADTETKSTVSRYEETSDTGETYTVVEATIYPGDPTGSKPDIEIGGLGGYTFNDTQSSDLTGTYKLYVRDAENTSEKINITVRARQFEA